jgi:catechol 2,3-dioxygenase-like lactoylglutathione lyase family enzyme
MLSEATIHAYIPVSNIARARKFYEEKLGLKPKADYAGGVIYECGGAKTAWFKDTEGNILAVSQRIRS